MSNAILTSSVSVPFAVNVDANLPILANGNVMLNKEFVGGAGTTVNYLIPSYGQAAVGSDITSRLRDVKSAQIPIVLSQYSDGYALDMVEQTLKLSSIDKQVDMPFANKFASDIQTIAANDIKLSAATATIVSTGAGAVAYTDIFKGVGALKSCRSWGEVFGAMSPALATAVQNSGVNYFQADLKQSFVNGGLGVARGARWFETADLNAKISIGAQTLTSVTVTSYTEGATSMTIGGTALTGTLVYGQILNVAGVNATDVYGNDSGVPYAVVVQDVAGVAAAGNAATITVKPIYWTSGPAKNVTATPVSKAVTSAHAANTEYQTVLIWDKEAFVTASAKLKGLAVSEKKGAVGKVINSLLQITSDGLKGLDVFRMDALVGFGMVYRQFAHRVDVKMG